MNKLTTHKGDTLLLIEVPLDAYDFKVEVSVDNLDLVYKELSQLKITNYQQTSQVIKNSTQNSIIELIGTTSTLTDKDVEPFVESYSQSIGWRLDGNNKKLPKMKLYTNYMVKKPIPITFLKETALESWNSFLQHNRIDLSKNWYALKVKND